MVNASLFSFAAVITSSSYADFFPVSMASHTCSIGNSTLSMFAAVYAVTAIFIVISFVMTWSSIVFVFAKPLALNVEMIGIWSRSDFSFSVLVLARIVPMSFAHTEPKFLEAKRWRTIVRYR